MGRMSRARAVAKAAVLRSRAMADAAPAVPAPTTHEAASQSRRMLGWAAPTMGPNDSMLGSLTTLRDRSRQATRNDGYARGAIDKLTSNIVGAGMQPLSQADDPEFRRQVQALWLLWTDESDADHQQDWYGQQDQAARCWLEAGECFLRLRKRLAKDRLRVSLQVQILEPELCPHDYNSTNPRNGNKIKAGIELDPIGRRAAYYFYAQRPGDFSDWTAGDYRRVDAADVLHLYRPLRPGQLRGLPHLTPALVRLRELDKFDDATLIRQQLAAMFVAFLKPATVDSGVTPLTGLEPEATDASGRTPLGLQPGIFQELEPGEEVEFSDPPDVIAGYADFMRQQLFAACAALGVPYEVLTGDMSRVNDRTVRVILGEFRRWVQQLQHNNLAFQVCRPVWSAWLDRVYFDGSLNLPTAYLQDPLPWQRVQWQPQGWPYLHPVQDVEAQQAAIRAGFTSRSAAVSEQGYNAELIDAQQAEDNARADALKLHYDSDARTPKAPKNPSLAASENPPAPAQEASA